MDEDASHPLYSISFNAHDMDIRDSAAFQNFGLAAGQGKGTACQEEDCDWETPVLDQFDTRVRRGFTVSGDTITISLSRRDLPRLPPFFYWKVWLTENADNSSQASFDDFVPKFVKPYAHLKADALQALRRYKEEVDQGKFPTDSESYH